MGIPSILDTKTKQKQWLVGGAITILKNMSSSMGRIIPYIVENKKKVLNQQQDEDDGIW